MRNKFSLLLLPFLILGSCLGLFLMVDRANAEDILNPSNGSAQIVTIKRLNIGHDITQWFGFSEPMDTSTIPTLVFEPLLETSLTNRLYYWMSETMFEFSATVADPVIKQDFIRPTSTIYGGRDLAGNFMVTATWNSPVQIDLKAPEITFVDDVAEGPSLGGETIQITSTDADLAPQNNSYGFINSGEVCDGINDSFTQSYISGFDFNIETTTYNGKYICAQAFDGLNNVTFVSSSRPLNVAMSPSVDTNGASDITSTSARLHGTVTALNGADIADWGFYYGTSNPRTFFTDDPGSGELGEYSFEPHNLTPGTVYQYIAMASNTAGIGVGTTEKFITAFGPTVVSPTSTVSSTYDATSTINVPLNLTNATLAFSDYDEGSANIQTPGPINVNVETSFGTVQLSIPDNTNIDTDNAHDAAWNAVGAILNLPTVKENSSVNITADDHKSAEVSRVIELGYGDIPLTLDKAARILIPGQGGKYAGYSKGGVFTKITAPCAADNQATGNALDDGADCKIDVGADLVIWTKHFTSFITYSQTTNPTSGGGGGGSSFVAPAPILKDNPVIVIEGSSVIKRNVNLRFNVEKAVEVAVSEDSSFNGASWIAFAVEKPFLLSEGNGTKTIYAKFRSEQRGETQAVLTRTTLSGQSITTDPVVTDSCPVLTTGDMVKVVGRPAIYILNKNMEVLYFPSGDVFKSWRPAYGGYKSISQNCFDTLKVPNDYPAAINFRPGSYVVKKYGADQLYVVQPGNTIAKINAESAKTLYGVDFKVMTISEIHWPHYVNRGVDISSAKPHAGMLINVNNGLYYVDAVGAFSLVSSSGLSANNLQTKFAKVLPESFLAGTRMGEAVSATVAEIDNIVQ